MRTTVDLITAVRDQAGSDRKAAPLFNVTQATFSRWRNGEDFPTDENCVRLAELLALDPVYVLAIVRHDRTQYAPAKTAWRRVADQFKDAAVVAALAIGAASFGGFNNNVFAGNSTPASGGQLNSNTHCDAKRRRRAVLGVSL